MMSTKVFKTLARVYTALFGFSALGFAQTAGSSSLNDPIMTFMGNGGYDAQDYDIALKFSSDHQTEQGTTTMTAVATQDLSSFNLDFGSMTVTSVIVNGDAARFVQADPELTISPNQAILQGESFKVSVTFAGKPDSKSIFEKGFGSSFWIASPDQLTVLAEPSAMFAWSPVNDHPTDKATFSLHLTAPKAEQAISNGVFLSRVENSDGTATSHYRIATPTASYFVVMAVGKFSLKEQGMVGKTRVRHYLSAKTSGVLRQAVLETPNILRFFEDKIGTYPFSEIGVLTVDSDTGYALETQSLVLLPFTFGSDLESSTEIVAHELAHQWFGAYVTFKSHADMWVHEGFAQYLSWVYTDSRAADFGTTPIMKQLESNYPRVVFGQSVTELNKRQFVDRLRSSRYGSALMVGKILEQALELMFEGTLPKKYHAEVLARFPNGARVYELAGLIEKWDFSKVFLSTPSRLKLIPLTGNPALNVPSYFGLNTPPGVLTSKDDIFNNGVYLRGAMALHALRLKVGDEKFFGLLRAYLRTYKFSNASVKDFVNLTLEFAGSDAKTLLEHWLFDLKCPDVPELGLFAKDFKLGIIF